MPDLLPEDTPEKERIFAMGREVDDLSRELFAGGVVINGFNQEGWKNTQKVMKNGEKVLFQPTVVSHPLTCRADILTKSKKGDSWDINEVKMATTVKKEYIYDTGFQKICFENAGIKIDRINLIHINREYVRHGEIEIKKLFISEDITDEVSKKLPEIKEEIEKALKVVKIKGRPDLSVILGCSNPQRCEYLECYCQGVPELYTLAGKISAKHLLAMLDREIIEHKKIHPDILKAIGHEPKKDFTEINANAIRAEFRKLEYPLHFFDYETYGVAIPPFDGMRPYQQIPFQYSLIVKDIPTSQVRHYEFLARKFENPIPELLARLKRDIGPKGSVIVWFASFESARNEEMAKMEPKFAKFLNDVNERIFDLMLIFKFKNQMYIKSEFNKLASLKIVLPVMCPELSYENLNIQGGGEASANWPVLTSDKTPAKEKAQIEKNMLAYCKRDTEAMVGIMDKVLEDIK